MKRAERASRWTFPVGAGMTFVLGVVVAALLPHHCIPITQPCPPREPCGIDYYCSGLGVGLRVGIAFIWLAAAGLLILLGRRLQTDPNGGPGESS